MSIFFRCVRQFSKGLPYMAMVMNRLIIVLDADADPDRHQNLIIFNLGQV